MIGAILFDLDGTLIDSVPDLTSAVNVALQGVGRAPKPESLIATYVGNGLKVLLEKSLAEIPFTKETFAKTQKLFEDYYETHCLDHTRIYPGVKETLPQLRGPKAVVTNKPERFTRKILEGLGLAGEFKVVLGGESTPFRKPRPEPLWIAAERLGIKPEETLMVGDSPVDVRAGKAARMMTCAVSYGLTKKEILESEKPDHLIDQFSQLKDIIQ